MKKRTVLIVDDQLMNRRILTKILENQYEIMTACDGVEAIEVLKKYGRDISAVLLDIVMPRMNGYEVLQEMSGNPLLARIPVLVSSQEDGEDAEIKALTMGAYDFVAKPYKPKIIYHRLANMIKLRETADIVNDERMDEVTGLYNKQFFMKRVQEVLDEDENENKDFDLIHMNVEHFKLVNDTYGMSTGDRLLRHIADILRSDVDGIGIYSCFGGDSFYLFLPREHEYTEEKIWKFMERVNDFPINLTIRMRFGIYRINDRNKNINAMCDRAQLAAESMKGMYDRNIAFYDDTIRQKLLKEQFVSDCMESALTNREFHVYYQPKYELYHETIAGAEALVRWIHPEKGFMSPGEFIPIFEKNGFISKLDKYVWETVCSDMKRWIDGGHDPLAVSVNVSRADIYDPVLPEILKGLVEKYEIPTEYLHLEITESAYVENPKQIIDAVGELRKYGFYIEMDDFGSGYSSLNMLSEIPIDILKLDMRFIQNENKNKSGKGVLSFAISLAKWLNLAVVAEGVESSEQIADLRTMDCNYVQGFYYAKPMPREEFEALLLRSKISEMNTRSATAAVEKRSTSDVREHGSVMLIVDDVEVNRAVLASCFEEQFTIREEENGMTAWEYLQDNYAQVDIIMLDLLMPVMDGFQLLERIRTNEQMREIPVIITSQGDENSEIRAMEMDADDFISKPYNPQIVQRRVRNVISYTKLQKMENGKNNEA